MRQLHYRLALGTEEIDHDRLYEQKVFAMLLNELEIEVTKPVYLETTQLKRIIEYQH